MYLNFGMWKKTCPASKIAKNVASCFVQSCGPFARANLRTGINRRIFLLPQTQLRGLKFWKSKSNDLDSSISPYENIIERLPQRWRCDCEVLKYYESLCPWQSTQYHGGCTVSEHLKDQDSEEPLKKCGKWCQKWQKNKKLQRQRDCNQKRYFTTNKKEDKDKDKSTVKLSASDNNSNLKGPLGSFYKLSGKPSDKEKKDIKNKDKAKTKDKVIKGAVKSKDKGLKEAEKAKQNAVKKLTKPKDQAGKSATKTKDQKIKGGTKSKDKAVKGATKTKDKSAKSATKPKEDAKKKPAQAKDKTKGKAQKPKPGKPSGPADKDQKSDEKVTKSADCPISKSSKPKSTCAKKKESTCENKVVCPPKDPPKECCEDDDDWEDMCGEGGTKGLKFITPAGKIHGSHFCKLNKKKKTSCRPPPKPKCAKSKTSSKSSCKSSCSGESESETCSKHSKKSHSCSGSRRSYSTSSTSRVVNSDERNTISENSISSLSIVEPKRTKSGSTTGYRHEARKHDGQKKHFSTLAASPDCGHDRKSTDNSGRSSGDDHSECASENSQTKLFKAAEHNVLEGLNVLSKDSDFVEGIHKYFGDDYANQSYYLYQPYSFNDLFVHLQDKRGNPHLEEVVRDNKKNDDKKSKKDDLSACSENDSTGTY